VQTCSPPTIASRLIGGGRYLSPGARGRGSHRAAVHPGASSEEEETDSKAVGGQDEARTRWQGMAGVPHCLSRRAGQVGDRAVLQPLLL
jgi:hypothetical protein